MHYKTESMWTVTYQEKGATEKVNNEQLFIVAKTFYAATYIWAEFAGNKFEVVKVERNGTGLVASGLVPSGA